MKSISTEDGTMITMQLTAREAAALADILRHEYGSESEKAETKEWPESNMHEEKARAVAKISAKLHAAISTRISEVQP